jgi:hypothetical protein
LFKRVAKAVAGLLMSQDWSIVSWGICERSWIVRIPVTGWRLDFFEVKAVGRAGNAPRRA